MRRRRRPINNYVYYNKKKLDIEPIIEKRYKIVAIIICILMTVLIVGLAYVQIYRNTYYTNKLAELTQNIIEGDSAPRGRIYDRNGNLLVDNVGVNTIIYKKKTGITSNEEITMAYKVAELIDVDYSNLNNYDLRYFWMKNHPTESTNKIKYSIIS